MKIDCPTRIAEIDRTRDTASTACGERPQVHGEGSERARAVRFGVGAAAPSESRRGQFELIAWLGLAVVATFFTNLQAISACVVAANLSTLVLVEKLQFLWSFVLVSAFVALASGASTYGYLKSASFVVCLAIQIPLSVAFVCHRFAARRYPTAAWATLVFPCVHIAVWVVAMYTLPIGSTGNPAYSATDFLPVLQVAAVFGRNAVTFLLAWTAACGARALVGGLQGARWAVRACTLAWAAIVLGGGIRLVAPHMFRNVYDWEGVMYQHQVSCLSRGASMYEDTEERLRRKDTVIVHAESMSNAFGEGGTVVAKYIELLEKSYQNTSHDAVVVISETVGDKTWYDLVTREGSQMRYAKNHPVPVIEAGLTPGPSPPSVVSATLDWQRVKVTGSTCFDTDFPWLTRRVGGADLWLETSATWSNIGERQFAAHKLVAIENGVTLVKCTKDGVTGAYDPHGNVLFRAPQTYGVAAFSIQGLKGGVGFPLAGIAFDVLTCLGGLAALAATCAAARRPRSGRAAPPADGGDPEAAN